VRSTEGTEAGWFGAEGAATNGLEKVTLASFVSVTGASVEDTVESVTGATVVVFTFFFCTTSFEIRRVVLGNHVRLLLLLGLSKTGGTVVVEVTTEPITTGSILIFVVTDFVVTGVTGVVTGSNAGHTDQGFMVVEK
jgi:hypothetical protein